MSGREAKRSVRSIRAEGYRQRTLSGEASGQMAGLLEAGGLDSTTLPLLEEEEHLRGWQSSTEEAPEGRKLWRLARTRVGLSQRERLDGRLHVEASGEGPISPPPLPDTHNLASMFVDKIAGGTLGSIAAAAEADDLEPPGMWSPTTDAKALTHMITHSYVNILLFCIPVGIAGGMMHLSPTLVFSMNFLSLLPLALILGEVTEDLAVRFGDTIGGLLNATFGNVVEMILAVAALQQGLYTVVATSLIGSILSNLLLVLGMCFFFGGITHKQQRFSTLANKMAASLLFLACVGLIIPSTAKIIYGPKVMAPKVLTNLSHAIALTLMFLYVCYLLFQLKTHAEMFEGEENTDQPALSVLGAMTVLLTITLVVAVCSEFLTGAIESVSKSSGINEAFLGLIVLPIAGNAAEHITAVFVAVKDKMDLAIGVALGSSIQIALFVIPVVVVAGWVLGKPFTLDFDAFSVLMLTVSVILAYFVSSDGYSNWLLGLQLIATYVLIASVFLLEREAASEVGGAATALPGHGADL